MVTGYPVPEEAQRGRSGEHGRDHGLAGPCICGRPAWVQTAEIDDPLGGDKITVNRYFQRNPDMMLGVLERSGSMRHAGNVTLRAHEGQDIGAALDAAIAKLPEGIAMQAATLLRNRSASSEALKDGLEIAMQGGEEGAVSRNDDGNLEQIMSREGGGRPRSAYPARAGCPLSVVGATVDGRQGPLVPRNAEARRQRRQGEGRPVCCL